MNCFAIEGETGWDLVDTGLNISHTHQGWKNLLEEYDLKWENIRSIYVTHYHPDHYGSAGWLQEKTGAPVYMSSRSIEEVNHVWQAGFDFINNFKDFYLAHGVPAEMMDNISGNMINTARIVFPELPHIVNIEEGEKVLLGKHTYEIIATPGHADGHICFYCPQNHILFSGDHLLPKITSNISLWPGGDHNPLQKFFSSLHKISDLETNLVLPAHGEIFTGVKKRVEELYRHHQYRLERMAQIAGEGKTAFEISQEVFGTDLSLHEIRFAISETLAHLVYLQAENKLKTYELNGLIYFQKA